MSGQAMCNWTEMTPEDRNALVEEIVFDVHLELMQGPIRPYSQDMSAAWEIVQHYGKQLFSKRRSFIMELYRLFRLPGESGSFLAWPDALIFLKPEHLCIAALRIEGIEVTYQFEPERASQ